MRFAILLYVVKRKIQKTRETFSELTCIRAPKVSQPGRGMFSITAAHTDASPISQTELTICMSHV